MQLENYKHWFRDGGLCLEDLRVNGIGVREVMGPGVVNRPAGTGDYLLMYFHGPVRIRVEDIIRTYPGGSLIIWDPQRGHYYGNGESEWMHSWLHCAGEFFVRIMEKEALPLNEVLAVPDETMVKESLLGLLNELITQSEPDPVIVRNAMETFVRRLTRDAGARPGARDVPAPILRVKAYVESSYASPISLESLADRANMSIPHLCSEFKKYFGTSAIAFLIQQRMHAATHHLKNCNYRVSDIARLVGYEDIYYFSKLFKKRFGVSPLAMRKRFLKDVPS